MGMETLRGLWERELQDLYATERQTIDALPGMINAATATSLREALEKHAQRTRLQLERLDLIFKQSGLDKGSAGQPSGIDTIVRGTAELIRQNVVPEVRDAAIIAAEQHIEHYEMAGYGCARTWARQLGEDNSAELLQQTLDEEGAADKELTNIAQSGINEEATAGIQPDASIRSRLRYVDVNDLPDSTRYRDTKVRNRAGEALGRVDGFLVDPSGRPYYMVVDSGGLFVGRRYLVPVGRADYRGDEGLFTVDLDKELLKRYPEFHRDAFLSMRDEEARRYAVARARGHRSGGRAFLRDSLGLRAPAVLSTAGLVRSRHGDARRSLGARPRRHVSHPQPIGEGARRTGGPSRDASDVRKRTALAPGWREARWGYALIYVGLRPTPRLRHLRGPSAPRRALAGALCAPCAGFGPGALAIGGRGGYGNSPRPLARRHLALHLTCLHVDDRQVVRGAVCRVDRAAVVGDCNSPGTNTCFHRAGNPIGGGVNRHDHAAAAGGDIHPPAIRRSDSAHGAHAFAKVDGLDHPQPGGIDDGDARAIFGRDVRARAVGQERNRSRPRAHTNGLHGLASRVDHIDGVVRLCRDEDKIRTGIDRHALGLAAHFERLDDLLCGDIDHAQPRRVLVRDKQTRPIVAHSNLFGIGSARQDRHELEAPEIDDANAVGGTVWRWQRAFVHARSCDG